MAEGDNESLGALRVQHSNEVSDESETELDSETDTEDERLTELPQLRESQLGELRSLVGVGGAEVNGDEREALTTGSSVQFSQNNHAGGLPRNSTRREESKEPDVISEQEATADITGQALQSQARNQLVPSISPAPLAEISPISVVQFMPLDRGVGTPCLPKADVRNSSSQKTKLNLSIVKASRVDGYNWRKYGQKQVKSPQGARSYYRCTYSECRAKKVEFCDQSGHVMETIYKSQHNHDPPRKVNSMRQSRIMKCTGSAVENNATENSTRVNNGSIPPTISRESIQDTPMVPEGQLRSSSAVNEDAETITKNRDALVSIPNHRGKKNSLSSPVLKPGKKPKLVVHAAGDMAISADGYRWRKYGQKMVKGNPHPRNYYRCTSAGCPVRKHTETAVDNVGAVIITYRGTHDHDKPVPKRRHGTSSGPHIEVASPANLNSSQSKRPDPSPTQKSPPTQWSDDKEGDLTGEAMESARTLLSIGFEIKQC